jgi:hypothetical protein
MWGTLIWRLKRSNHSKIRSAQKRYPCDRYVVLPMSPGWTWEIWRRGGDSNPGHPFGVKLISSQPCSATPAPLREKLSRPDFVCRGLARISISSPCRTSPSERRILRSRRAVFSRRVELPALVRKKAAIAKVSGPRLQNITANRAIVAGQRRRVLNLIAFALRELQSISCRIPQRLQRIRERSPRLRRRIRHQCRVQSIQRCDHPHIRFARSVAVLRGHHVPQKSPQARRNNSQKNSPAQQYRAQRFRRRRSRGLARRGKICSAMRTDFRRGINFRVAMRANVHKLESFAGFANSVAVLS